MPIQPTQQQILERGTYGNSGEKMDWTYYDTMKIDNTVATYDFYSIPNGQQGKNLADTNFPLSSVMPSTENFNVFALKVWFVTDDDLDTDNRQMIYTMFERTTVEIKIGGKDSMGTFKLIELFGTSSLIALTPTVAGDNIPLIQPSFKGIMPINNRLTLAASTPFRVRLTHWTLPNEDLKDCKIVFGMNGTLFRAS